MMHDVAISVLWASILFLALSTFGLLR